MQYDDDIAFQRAILANPADTTMKLVYADWLQDRSDPREEYLRLQVKLQTAPSTESAVEAASWFVYQGDRLDPNWVALMKSLAMPFAPIEPFDAQLPQPFSAPIGRQGSVITFPSLRTAADLNNGLLADLTFLTGIDWDPSYTGDTWSLVESLICELGPVQAALTDETVRAALRVDEQRWDWAQQSVGSQFLFDHFADGDEWSGAHGRVKRYVRDGRLWYATLNFGELPAGLEANRYRIGLAVGHSPHGNRLIGAITFQSFAAQVADYD